MMPVYTPSASESSSRQTLFGPPKYGDTNFGRQTQSVNTDDPNQIDSALCAALSNPREATGLVSLEERFVGFMESSHSFAEVSGRHNSEIRFSQRMETGIQNPNSFQKLLLHRLADRFGLVREKGTSGSVRVVKAPHSKVPKALVKSILPPSPTTDAAPVVQLLKRAPRPHPESNETIRNPRTSTTSVSQDTYQQARSRIFQESPTRQFPAAAPGLSKAHFRQSLHEVSDPDFQRRPQHQHTTYFDAYGNAYAASAWSPQINSSASWGTPPQR